MARLSSEIKRGFLYTLARQADANGLSLLQAIEAFQDAGFESIKDGQIIASTANGANSVSFSVPNSISQLSPDESFALSTAMLEACERALAALTAAGNSAPTVTQVKTQMLEDDEFYGTNTSRQSIAGLRYS